MNTGKAPHRKDRLIPFDTFECDISVTVVVVAYKAFCVSVDLVVWIVLHNTASYNGDDEFSIGKAVLFVANNIIFMSVELELNGLLVCIGNFGRKKGNHSINFRLMLLRKYALYWHLSINFIAFFLLNTSMEYNSLIVHGPMNYEKY